MLHAHYKTIAQLSSHANLKYLIRDYFDLPRTTALMPALLARGLGQADLVLSLLRVRDQHETMRIDAETIIAALIGHPICIGPGCLGRYKCTSPYVRIDRSPRITYVQSVNPRMPNTDAYHRWNEYKVGRSVSQLRARGVSQRDIRRAAASGWIRLEEVAQ